MNRLPLFAVVALLLATSAAQAQLKNADWKIVGEKNSYYTGRVRQRHAYDHAQVLSQVGKDQPKVSKEIVQQHAQAVRANSTAAMAEFNKIKAANPDNKAVQDQVKTLQEHHAKLTAMCKMLDEMCAKGDAEGDMVCDCCLTIAKDMEAADKEAEKLRETLKIAPLAQPKAGSSSSK